MPRRRSTKVRSKSGKPRPINRSEGNLKKWEKISDIPLDEEDQFHASRDKILLDGKDLIDDDDGDGDEVFALKGLDDESEDDGGEDEDVDMDDLDDEEVMEKTLAPKTKKQKAQRKKELVQSESSEEPESEEETWGRSKSAYYSSNAPQLDSDDEEANELEEQEAKRLQAKSREDLEDADFGLEDIGTHEGTNELLEHAPVAIAPVPQDTNSIIRHLEKTSPETLALTRDWEDTAYSLMETQTEIAKAQADETSPLSIRLMHLRYQTLLSYTTTLAFYIYLRSSEKYVQRPESLRSHPVMGRLLTLKQALATIEEFETGVKLADEDSEDNDLTDLMWEDGVEMLGLDKDELKLLLMDAEHVPPQKPPKKKRKTSTKASKSDPPVDSSVKEPVFDLVEPEFTSSKSSVRIDPDVEMTDAYGETSSLQHADAADKKARKKTLRFHTSKIESASARRQGARNQAVGGDDDIPYRERRKEKEARLAKEAAAKVKGQGGADLDDTAPELEVRTRKDQEDDSSGDEANDPDGYYELVKKKSKARKDQKKAEYEAAQAAERFDNDEQDSMSGPRSLTRAILANKGLTPHRAKAVRNPRVKKRQKFEKAKKKLSSQKPIFKGGLAASGGKYDGEKSGISKVVKSVRLG